MSADPMFLQKMRKSLQKKLSEFDNTDDLLQQMRELLVYPEFTQRVQQAIDHYTVKADILKERLEDSQRQETVDEDGNIGEEAYDANVDVYLSSIMSLNDQMEDAIEHLSNQISNYYDDLAQAEAQAAADAREAYYMNPNNYINPNYARGGYTAKSNLMKQGNSRKFSKNF
jgi:hypothetical protein